MSFRLDRLANQLDWNLLRTYMVIVQERSITGASQQLNVTQPSVSAALRRLEERLDVQLIERGSGRIFNVTAAGEKVYREALEIYGGVVRLGGLNQSDGQLLSGNIVVYRSTHLDMRFLNPLLAAFQAKHPAISVSLTSVQCADVIRALQQRVASLGFCTQLQTAPQIKHHQLPSQEFGFFCGEQHPLYRNAKPDASVLAKSDTIGFEGETLTGALAQIVRYRARNEVGDRMVATTSSIVDLINMLIVMPAIGCMAVRHAQQHAPELWQIPLPESNPCIDVYAITDSERHINPAERAMLEFLAEQQIIGAQIW